MRSITLHAPARPFASCVTDAPITARQATDPAYWARQLREPVRFAEGLASVVGDRQALLVECGPRETLTSLGLQILPGRAVSAALLPIREGVTERTGFQEGLGALWRHGLDRLSWGVLNRQSTAVPVNLPGYPFDRRRLWVEEGAGRAVGRRGAGDLRGLLQDQLQLIQDQLNVLRGVASASNGQGAGE
jgi:acyl transferase domain-containing protein